MAFREFPKGMTAPEVEHEVLGFWDDDHIFEQSVSAREGAERFVFFEGPPTANGHPGVHHVLARTIKDIICRYKTMSGYQVERKAGWDTHGLPVEIAVEKQLNLESKEDIEKLGVAEFVKQCHESVFTYKEEWEELTKRMAYWVDMSDPYITCSNDYIESIWHILKLMWDRDLIYQGHNILPYCPRCGTPLSSHEVAQGYADTEDPSIFVRMKLKGETGTSFLVWTTTPWTLISNVAVAIAPDETYVVVDNGEEKLILAEALLSVLQGSDGTDGEKQENDDGIAGEGTAWKVVEKKKGADLVGTEYEPLYSFVPFDERGHYVIAGDFVTLDDGTGIVHIAPAFGEDDSRAGNENALPFLQPVDGAGKFTEEITPWAGMFIKDADPLIMSDLETRGLMYKRSTVVHTYPFCWRCDSPLVYYARNSWYLRTTQFKDAMIENNRAINWHPKEIGSNRLGNWLENNVDWAISRDRYWGTPLNVWICDECGAMDSMGSIAELKERAVELPEGELDLHKPVIDSVHLKCLKCSGSMTRTPEVIDCWFDTGSMPYAQWHWPFENAEEFNRNFPADFIAEGVDQTRGWFYSLLAISTIVSGTSSFKRCVVNDMVLDKNAKKMSKRVGNIVDSMAIMEKYGADALRWYLMATSPPWIPTRFDSAGVTETASKVIGTLRNTYGFFSLYANIDGFDAAKHDVPLSERPMTDRWIMSRLHSTVSEVTRAMENYDITKAVRRLQHFVLEDVSNWYVRLSRARFWKGEMDEDKRAAFATLFDVLLTTARTMAPFAPLISEAIYRSLREGASGEATEHSVHLSAFPAAIDGVIDEKLEANMGLARSIVVLGRAARNVSGIKVRQPLSKILVSGVPEAARSGVEELEELILAELNVKSLEWAEAGTLAVLKATPIFPVLGPKHGKNVNQVAEAIRALPEEDAGTVQAEGTLTAGLDLELTEELMDEGFAREMVNKIQFMRKEAGFEVVDRINVYYEAGPRLRKAVERFASRIAGETLAECLTEGREAGELGREWDVNGEEAWIAVERVKKAQ
jgi:isoleucyl-tRNA synthetase